MSRTGSFWVRQHESWSQKVFSDCAEGFIAYTMEKGTLEEDLIEHGWKKLKNGKIVEPSYNEMLKRTQLKTVLGQHRFSKYSVPVSA